MTDLPELPTPLPKHVAGVRRPLTHLTVRAGDRGKHAYKHYESAHSHRLPFNVERYVTRSAISCAFSLSL